MIHYTGSCKWSLDAYCEDGIDEDKIPNLEQLTLEDCQDEDSSLDFWYYTMRLKSELLGLEIVAHSWSEESDFDMVEHFKDGECISTEMLYYIEDFYDDDENEDEDEEEEKEMFVPVGYPGEIPYEFPF